MGDVSWWLLILGVVGGALLTWIVLADSTRREREIGDEEMTAEAAWIARTLDRPGVDAEVAEDVLRAHRRYLGFPPPDVLVSPDELVALAPQGIATAPPPDLVADADGTDTDVADSDVADTDVAHTGVLAADEAAAPAARDRDAS